MRDKKVWLSPTKPLQFERVQNEMRGLSTGKGPSLPSWE